MKDDCPIVGRVDGGDAVVRARLGADQFAGEQGIEGPLNVVRGERLSVVKMYVMAQVKDVRQGIGDLPLLGQRRLEIEMFIAAHERVEKQLVDALGLGVEADAGIEIGRAALDDHDQRVGIVGAGAGKVQQQEWQ